MSDRGVTVVLPYRGRETQVMHLLPRLLRPGRNVAHVVVAEQGNSLAFNRGAVKNAGFDAAVQTLGLSDSDTVCFHDVDVCPEDKFGAYPSCLPNEIWHLYGHEHCLGGVVCVTVGDFKRMGKFAHWDRWGREDTDLMQQAQRCLVHVNHTRFTHRFKPSALGFYEVDAKGRRQSTKDIRQTLMAKIQAAPKDDKALDRGTKTVFQTCMAAPTLSKSTLHYVFLP